MIKILEADSIEMKHMSSEADWRQEECRKILREKSEGLSKLSTEREQVWIYPLFFYATAIKNNEFLIWLNVINGGPNEFLIIFLKFLFIFAQLENVQSQLTQKLKNLKREHFVADEKLKSNEKSIADSTRKVCV